jgi:predicted GIY-YIG superfamily endonuclease
MVIYLIHFDRPYKHAQHYLGSTENLEERLARHRSGHGAKLLKTIQEAGIDWKVVRVWENATREMEATFKRVQHNKRYCPICNPNLQEKLYSLDT